MNGGTIYRPDLLRGRNVLVTGASSGVGRHLAVTLAGHGANVACCARRADRLADLVSEIERRGGRGIALSCDVADLSSIRETFDRAAEAFGAIDSVIANAGTNTAGPALALEVADLDAVLAVNLRGAFLTATEGARRMIDGDVPEDRRRIVFIASILGARASRGTAAYSATKAGVMMMARSLGLEWARRQINVNAVCPGYMPTEIVEDWFETDGGKAEMAAWPRRRLMPVEALDDAVLYLLSSAGRYVTGTALTVDDGQSL